MKADDELDPDNPDDWPKDSAEHWENKNLAEELDKELTNLLDCLKFSVAKISAIQEAATKNSFIRSSTRR